MRYVSCRYVNDLGDVYRDAVPANLAKIGNKMFMDGTAWTIESISEYPNHNGYRQLSRPKKMQKNL